MILPNIRSSLLRFCSDFAAAREGMQALDFDAIDQDSQVPAVDVIGISGLSVDLDDKMASCRVQIGISTVNDTNLFRLYQYAAALLEAFVPAQWLPLYDADTGQQIGRLIVENGTRLLPVGDASSRPVQYLMASLATTETFKS
jgi:hypothetical protein